MCCCEKPVVNGEMGYKWQPTDREGVRPISAPAITEGDELLYDEMGRCGEIDSHCHHYRIVKNCGNIYLLVRNGGGDDRIRLSLYGKQVNSFAILNSNDRYWLLNAIYHAHSEGKRNGRDRANEQWRKAAIEKRIKTRKIRGSNAVKVWIDE
jgi:hypothetical protein